MALFLIFVKKQNKTKNQNPKTVRMGYLLSIGHKNEDYSYICIICTLTLNLSALACEISQLGSLV